MMALQKSMFSPKKTTDKSEQSVETVKGHFLKRLGTKIYWGDHQIQLKNRNRFSLRDAVGKWFLILLK